MKHFIFIILSTLIWLVSCSSAESTDNSAPKHYQFGVYTFTEAKYMPNTYSCPMEDIGEARELFELLFQDVYNHKDYKDRKYFQKYGVIIEAYDIVDSWELRTYKEIFIDDSIKQDLTDYVVCKIYTPEEYEQREKEFQQSEQEKNNRLKSLE